jgi:predicted DNA-binding transcriptional regulator YafY
VAERFEVSVRTIYRDVEVLSASGVPVYSLQGKNGGISLIEDYTVSRLLLPTARRTVYSLPFKLSSPQNIPSSFGA